jgi:hypothetical protein
MDIHKPKPWHSFREFLKEYLIIVVGVLTALGAEQVVETLHHRSEVAEARHALDAEVSFDLASFEFARGAQMACMDQRLDEFARWRQSWETGTPLRLRSPLPIIPGVVFRTSVWRVASVAALAQMPFQARVDYGKFYDFVAVAEQQETHESETWRDIMRLAHARRLDDEQRLRLDNDIDELRRSSRGFAGRERFVTGYARALKLKPSTDAAARFQVEFGDAVRDFCRPILPAPGSGA